MAKGAPSIPMRKFTIPALIATILFAISVGAQTAPAVKRSVTKTDRFDFGAGGSIAITGPPVGSIKVVPNDQRNEIEITAEIELQADSEADLDTLAKLTGFVTDESTIKVSIITVGVHNKFGLKKLPKDFPKRLASMPFTIDYTIKVPKYADLEIDGGKGDLAISGIEGSMRVNFLESNAKVEIVGGNTFLMIGSGTLSVDLGPRGWRGRFADIQIANGDMTVRLPSNLSAEIDASIAKNGSIENLLTDLKPRDRKVPFTERSIVAKAGVGGSPLKFLVGSGKMRLERLARPL